MPRFRRRHADSITERQRYCSACGQRMPCRHGEAAAMMICRARARCAPPARLFDAPPCASAHKHAARHGFSACVHAERWRLLNTAHRFERSWQRFMRCLLLLRGAECLQLCALILCAALICAMPQRRAINPNDQTYCPRTQTLPFFHFSAFAAYAFALADML